MCHISHLYATGCSLYYTWIARQHPGHELQQWRDAKTVASQAIMDAGGTITHHHAVGIDHRPYLRAEIGDAGMALLQAMKDTTDPVGILNPGKLL
jgi:alkyldihydroxyacetonephosphate synthase